MSDAFDACMLPVCTSRFALTVLKALGNGQPVATVDAAGEITIHDPGYMASHPEEMRQVPEASARIKGRNP
jgi:hypothetical protein